MLLQIVESFISSVADTDPNLDTDPDPFVRCMNPDADFSIIKQK